MMLIFFFCIFALNCPITFGDKCCEISFRESPGYVLVKSNAKSLKTIIARKEVLNVEKCKEFAESKKALAFNFGRENSKNSEFKKMFKNVFQNIKKFVLEKCFLLYQT